MQTGVNANTITTANNITNSANFVVNTSNNSNSNNNNSNDLELQDLDLKSYMDPAILLDTFPPVDMDMWHSYNSFLVEENLSNGLKLDHSHHHQTDGASSDSSSSSSSPTEIKEEHIDMECCFSSICPNDLIASEFALLANTTTTTTTNGKQQREQTAHYNNSTPFRAQ